MNLGTFLSLRAQVREISNSLLAKVSILEQQLVPGCTSQLVVASESPTFPTESGRLLTPRINPDFQEHRPNFSKWQPLPTLSAFLTTTAFSQKEFKITS